jgi:hypothetical protein
MGGPGSGRKKGSGGKSKSTNSQAKSEINRLSKAKKTMNASDRAKADRRINQLGRVLNK